MTWTATHFQYSTYHCNAPMEIRAYRETDLMDIVKLFHDTVHKINIRDYSSEQVNAWATGTVDMDAWNRSLLQHHTFIATDGCDVLGFGDIDHSGYLDRLYVHHACQRQGIATALCHKLESSVDTDKIIVHASITARPFFEKRGYKIIREQSVDRCGISLKNYVMELSRSCSESR